MKVLLSLFITLTIGALSVPALAEESLSTPSGEARVIKRADGGAAVSVGGHVISLGEAAWYASFARRLGNLVLVQISSGGNACPATYRWLDTTRGALRLSEEFGTCSDRIEVTHDSETATVTMPPLDPSSGPVAYIFDGAQVFERQLPLERSPLAAAAEGDPDAWIGHSPYDYLRAADYEPRLIALMGWETLDALRNAIAVGSQAMVVEGDWIVGEGCWPHNCAEAYAAIAIHREDGSFIAALKLDGERPRLLGAPRSALPPAVRSVLTGR